MKDFENLKRIILNLTEVEKKNVLKMFLLNFENGIRNKNLFIEVFKLVTENNSISSNELQLKLYGGKKADACRKLVSRMYNRIMDILILNENIESNPFYENRIKEILSLTKKIIHVTVLSKRGFSIYCIDNLDEIIKRAIDCEYFDILLHALYLRRDYYVLATGGNAYKKLMIQIDYYEQVRSAFHKSLEYFNYACSFIGSKSGNTQKENYIAFIISELKNIIAKYNIKTVKYYSLYIEASNLEDQAEYEKSSYKFVEMIKLLNENKNAVYSKIRMGSAFVNIGNCELMLFNFKLAKHYLAEAYKLLGQSRGNADIIKELYLLIKYYENDLNNFEKSLMELIKNSLQIAFSSMQSKLNYYHAVLNTLRLNFGESNLLLMTKDSSEFESDQWKLAARVLIIINNIEMEKYELTDHQIDSFRKYIDRLKKKDFIKPRDLLISNIIIDLHRKSYNFKVVWNSRKDIFDLLDSKDKNYVWRIKSPEMIVFHEWFRAKKDGRPYDHGQVMEKMKKKLGRPV